MKQRWLRRLIRALLGASIAVDRREDIGAALLALHLQDGKMADEAITRERLQRVGIRLDDKMPSMEGVQGFWPAAGLQDMAGLWQRLQIARTLPEQIAAYLQALETSTPNPPAYSALPTVAGSEWPRLEEAIVNESARDEIIVITDLDRAVCPRHPNITLPNGEIGRLGSDGIAVALYCCRCLILLKRD